MNRKFKNILLNNWTLAFLITLVTVLVFQPVKNKFLAQLEKSELAETGRIVNYSDLDFDGKSERIILETNQKGKASIKIYNPALLGQLNANTLITERIPGIFITDTDSDRFKEIYFIGLRNDSVFVNQINSKSLIDPEEFFIDKLPPGSDAILCIEQTSDLNNDGCKEILLTIRGGFIQQPRKIYSLDVRNNLVLKTPLTGSIVAPQIIQDIDGDGFKEILSGTFAYRNYEKDEIPYSDYFSWVMVFDHNLDFKFEPIKISDRKTDTNVLPFQINEETYILAVLNIKDSASPFFKYHIIDNQGKIIYSDSIYETKSPNINYCINQIPQNDGGILLLTANGTCYQINDKFKLKKIWNNPQLANARFLKKLDLAGDGKNKSVFSLYNSNTYFIADEKFKHFSTIKLPSIIPYKENISLYHPERGTTQLAIQKEEEIFYITYRKNPFWNFRFVIWAGILCSVYGLLWIIQLIQKERIKIRLQAQHQVKELQYKVITSQLNPHFTFNALNSISKSVYSSENPEAYDRFATFSRLIRTVLGDTDKIARTLENELRFTEDFLKIQKFRFKDAFGYHIEVSKNVNTKIQVPKLIVQIFTENAIKHAFPSEFGKDRLTISVNQSDYLFIEIEDNGIGREKAMQNAKKNPNKSTGIGLKVMQEYLGLLNRENTKKIVFQITDLYNGGKPCGTNVVIKIPEKFKYI